jgi:hypothetical protein
MTLPKARVNCVALSGEARQCGGMKRLIIPVLSGLLILTCCAPLNTYYKPGASVPTLNKDTTACEVQALRDVPPSTLTRLKPPVYIPAGRTCNAAGQCVDVPGYYVPGGYETYDPNDGLRLRVERQCMADKGYAPVSIPACPDAVAKAAPLRATRTLPRLTETSCVIHNADGSFQIVNRG